MAECRWSKDEICVNADCPMCADYCPVPNDEGVCIFEERISDEKITCLKRKATKNYEKNKKKSR